MPDDGDDGGRTPPRHTLVAGAHLWHPRAMGPDRGASRVAGRRGLRSWALLGGAAAAALVVWVAVALLMSHGDDVGLVVLTGVLVVGIAVSVVQSTDRWSSGSDPDNRRPGVGPSGRSTDPGCGGGDHGGG